MLPDQQDAGVVGEALRDRGEFAQGLGIRWLRHLSGKQQELPHRYPFVPTARLKVYRRRLPTGSGPSTAAVLISG